MALTILGTYPIINKQTSAIDDNGIQTISYVFTVKSENAYSYIPAKDAEYYGPGVNSSSSSTTFASQNSDVKSKYLVTHVGIETLNGGLTQIVVSTAGSQNTLTPPRIEILPNYPLIFGLSGGLQANVYSTEPNRGDGRPNAGLAVMSTFITKNNVESESEIFNNFAGRIMPSSFRGISFPVPARTAGQWGGGSVTTYQFGVPTVGTGNRQNSNYFGFIAKQVTLQRIGGVTLFKLIYSESGYYMETACSGPNNTECATNEVYNY